MNAKNIAIIDPFELAMRELERRGETLERTLEKQHEQFPPDDEDLIAEYRNIRGE